MSFFSLGPLWEKHCKKEFPRAEREEFESYREMFERCSREREEKLERLSSKMGASYKQAKESVRKTKMAFVGVNAKPPRHIRKTQERTGMPSAIPSNYSAPSTSSSGGGLKRGRPPIGAGQTELTDLPSSEF